MFSSPRVIAIDDEPHDLDGLANGLNRHGVACLRILFTEESTAITPCPDVRVIFADLHLGAGAIASDHATDFSTLTTLLEDSIAPTGPYVILLWTSYPDQAAALRSFLEERLLHATKPFDVRSLAKADHLDGEGRIRDEERLMDAIKSLTGELPQIGALFDWERRVLGAVGNTVSSLLELASTQEADRRPEEVGRILAKLGIEAAGRDHVDSNRFRAVNEALLPILADRIANLSPVGSDADVWRAAFNVTGSQRLSREEAARLNRMAHIAHVRSEDRSERGVVIPLPAPFRGNFAGRFGINESDAALREFRCKDFAANDDRFRWMLVQAQAACDYAQSHPGPLPWHLGLEMPDANTRSGTPPASLWISPAVELSGDVRLLCVSARFPVSPSPDDVRCTTPIYRLREQLLNDLIYHLHSHGARPGMISFRP